MSGPEQSESPPRKSRRRTILAVWLVGTFTVIGGLIPLLDYLGISPTDGSPTTSTSSPTPPTSIPNSASSSPHTPEGLPSGPSAEGEPSSASPEASSNEITEVRIEVDAPDSRWINPTTIKAGESPGFEPYVFTDEGRLGRAGCYVKWELYNNGKRLSVDNTLCQTSAGWSSVYWPRNSRLRAGTMEVRASVTTDTGQSGSTRLALNVQ